MRSEYVFKQEVAHVLGALTPENRLACEISLATGLRIGDVLSLKTEQILKSNRFSVLEQKTGKVRRLFINQDLRERCLVLGGKIFVFPGRLDGRKHRTRQAVYKDLRRAAKAFRCKAHLSPHSLRKVFAVENFHKHGDLKRVQKLLNHDSEAVTMVYAMADELTKRRG